MRQVAIACALHGMANAYEGGEVEVNALEPLVIEICKARQFYRRQMETVNLDDEPLLENKLLIIRDMAIPFYVKDMLRLYTSHNSWRVRILELQVLYAYVIAEICMTRC